MPGKANLTDEEGIQIVRALDHWLTCTDWASFTSAEEEAVAKAARAKVSQAVGL